MTALAGLVRGFAALLTPAAGDDVKLTEWIAQTRAVDLPHLHSPTNGFEMGRSTVDGTVTSPCRNGRAEGVNSRTEEP